MQVADYACLRNTPFCHVVYSRLHLFTRLAYVIPLIDSLNFYRYQHQCKLLGYVIMPDHIHLMLWPQTEDVLSTFMRDFKKFTAIRLIRQAEAEKRDDLLNAFADAGRETERSQNKVWQDSYWDKSNYVAGDEPLIEIDRGWL
jgi:putative transposase